MSDDAQYNRSSGGSNAPMAFIVGGLVVAVGVIAYFLFGGGIEMVTGGSESTIISVETQGGSPGASGETEGESPAGGGGGGSAGGDQDAGGASQGN